MTLTQLFALIRTQHPEWLRLGPAAYLLNVVPTEHGAAVLGFTETARSRPLVSTALVPMPAAVALIETACRRAYDLTPGDASVSNEGRRWWATPGPGVYLDFGTGELACALAHAHAAGLDLGHLAPAAVVRYGRGAVA